MPDGQIHAPSTVRVGYTDNNGVSMIVDRCDPAFAAIIALLDRLATSLDVLVELERTR